MRADRRVEIGYVPAVDDVIPAAALEDYDALILFAYQLRRASLPANRRLGVVARFGVGYDSVDVEALADEGVATTITPGGVQRPVAVAILALVLALANKLMAKDRLARRGRRWLCRSFRADRHGAHRQDGWGLSGLAISATEMVRIMQAIGARIHRA